MKRFIYSTLAVLALFACTKTPEEKKGTVDPDPDPSEQTGGYDSINVTLAGSNVKTVWAEGDEIQIYEVTDAGADVESKYVLSSGAGSATGTFVPASGFKALEKGGADYFAAYPYDEDRTFAQHNTFTVVIPAEQTGALPIFAHAEDAASLELASFVGAIKFTLTGDAEITSIALEDANTNTPLSGNVTYNASTGKMSIKNASASKHQITYVLASKLVLENTTSDTFIIEIPAGALADGGKLTLFDPNGNAAATIDITAQTITAGAVANLGNFEFEAVSQTVDLSVAGTANSYIIPGTGAYTFKAVKGNTNEAVNAASVEVLWETRLDTLEVNAGDIIKSVEIKNGNVVVETVKPMVPGNALVAAKDSDGNILWSWHLWLPETPVSTVADPDKVFYATELMDRNLGALTATDTTAVAEMKSYGLGFQWGRVTPLVSRLFTVGGEELSGVEGAYDINYWIAHPTEVTNGTDSNWLDSIDETLWDNNGEKSIYDPCPPGYKVPVYNTEYYLWKVSSSGSYDDYWTRNQEQRWIYFNEIKHVFPVCGYIDGAAAKTTKEGIRALIWSNTIGAEDTTKRGSASFIDVSRDAGWVYYKSYFKYAGGTVRCALEH